MYVSVWFSKFPQQTVPLSVTTVQNEIIIDIKLNIQHCIVHIEEHLID